MPMLILDPYLSSRVRQEFESTYPNRREEVWEGVYVVAPLPNNEHQNIGTGVVSILRVWLDPPPTCQVFAGCNVSDRETDWEHNFRCPDVAVYPAGNPAKDCGTHWFGGPDFLVEILSPGDRARDKLPFYSAINTREALILDRDPWRLELYRRQGGQLVEVGRCDASSAAALTSSVLPLSFALVPGTDRPMVLVTHADARTWLA